MLSREFSGEVESQESLIVSKDTSVRFSEVVSALTIAMDDLKMFDVKDAFSYEYLECDDDLEVVEDDPDQCVICPDTQQSNLLSFNCADNLSHDNEHCFVTQHVDKTDPPEGEGPQPAVEEGESEPSEEGNLQQHQSQLEQVEVPAAEVTQQSEPLGVSFNLDSPPPLRSRRPSSAPNSSITKRTTASQKIQSFIRRRLKSFSNTPSPEKSSTPPINLFQSLPLLDTFEEGNENNSVIPDPTVPIGAPTSTFISTSKPATVDPPTQVPVNKSIIPSASSTSNKPKVQVKLQIWSSHPVYNLHHPTQSRVPQVQFQSKTLLLLNQPLNNNSQLFTSVNLLITYHWTHLLLYFLSHQYNPSMITSMSLWTLTR